MSAIKQLQAGQRELAEMGRRPCLLLLGDSTVATTYLPDEHRFHRVLAKELAGFALEAEIHNAADNGEFIARFLLSGSYDKMLQVIEGADVVVLRFGVNDEKRVDAEEFGAHLRRLTGLLTRDFPGARIVLETGIFMDPAHYMLDRNQWLLPYWQKVREVANDSGFLLCDVYEAMQRETAAGNWDLRVRRPGADGRRVLDASEDGGRETDMAWFSDVHPNVEGTRLAAHELARCLAMAFPASLPCGNTRSPRPVGTAARCSEMHDFPTDRLAALANPPWRPSESVLEDGLQGCSDGSPKTP